MKNGVPVCTRKPDLQKAPAFRGINGTFPGFFVCWLNPFPGEVCGKGKKIISPWFFG
jgi:hypothetical protein